MVGYRQILKGSGMLYNSKCGRIIFVKARPLERVLKPSEGEPSTVKEYCCYYFNRGYTVLDKGQIAKLSLSCRNNSTASVEKVGRANEQQRIRQAMSLILKDWISRVKCLSEVNPNDKTRFKF
jgi:hypothetical protein